jgi:hypothetical protein
MEYAAPAMSSFPGEEEPGSFTVECGSPLNELLDGRWRFFDKSVDSGDITKTISGNESVVFVEFHFIVIAEGGGNAALGIFRRRFAEAILGDDENAARRSQLYGGTKTCYAGTDNYEVGLYALDRGNDKDMIAGRLVRGPKQRNNGFRGSPICNLTRGPRLAGGTEALRGPATKAA